MNVWCHQEPVGKGFEAEGGEAGLCQQKLDKVQFAWFESGQEDSGDLSSFPTRHASQEGGSENDRRNVKRSGAVSRIANSSATCR